MLLLRLSGLLLLREAERQFLGLLIQEPPRSQPIPEQGYRRSIGEGDRTLQNDMVEHVYANFCPRWCV